MNQAQEDVVIIGGGVIGLAAALALLRDGRSVTVIERAHVGAGSSHGNCGTITPSHALPLAAPGMIRQALQWMLSPAAPLYIRPRLDPGLWNWLWHFALRCNRRDYAATARIKADLLLASRQLLEEWITREQLDCHFRACGLWYVFRDPFALERAQADAELLRSLNIPVNLKNSQTVATEEPALRPGMAGALEFPGDACLRPDRLVSALAARVRERGGRIDTNTAVLALDSVRDYVRVATANGSRQARYVILACGAWSPLIARRLGIRLPVQPGKGYSITYTRPAQMPRRPLVLRERSVCVTAWEDGFRLGSTMEFSGYDTRLNPVRLNALRRAATEYLIEPEGPRAQERWYGWRPMTWDDLPIIGSLPKQPRVIVATGHGMLGVSLAAVTAQLIADRLAGRAPIIDPAPLSPQRFA